LELAKIFQKIHMSVTGHNIGPPPGVQVHITHVVKYMTIQQTNSWSVCVHLLASSHAHAPLTAYHTLTSHQLSEGPSHTASHLHAHVLVHLLTHASLFPTSCTPAHPCSCSPPTLLAHACILPTFLLMPTSSPVSFLCACLCPPSPPLLAHACILPTSSLTPTSSPLSFPPAHLYHHSPPALLTHACIFPSVHCDNLDSEHTSDYGSKIYPLS